MTQHLIIGASGQVGENLSRVMEQKGIKSSGTYYSNPINTLNSLDIQDEANTIKLIEKIKPQAIHLPASLTHVDYCEDHPEMSYAINVQGVKNVVRGANRVSAKLVYFSSDYVFDGMHGPYLEEDAVNPLSIYGKHKVFAEHYISLFAMDYLIIRTTVVYGWESQGKNFVARLIKATSKGEVVKAPDDQVGSPTLAANLAEVTLELVEKNLSGIFHVVGPGVISRYEFARKAGRVFGLPEENIQPVKTKELNQSAPRPKLAGMLTDKVTQVVTTPLLDVEQGLTRMHAEKGKWLP